jgi:hypothetical protein
MTPSTEDEEDRAEEIRGDRGTVERDNGNSVASDTEPNDDNAADSHADQLDGTQKHEFN